MDNNKDIESLEKKNKKTIKTKPIIPIKEDKPVVQYSTSSNVVLNFINTHKEDVGNKAVVPSTDVSCLDCLFARWRKETDSEGHSFLNCYCKDLNIPIWNGAMDKEVTDCDGPAIGRALAKKVDK